MTAASARASPKPWTEIPASIRQLFEQIDLSSKPYWKI